MLRVVPRVATFCNTPGNGLANFCKAVFFCAMSGVIGAFDLNFGGDGRLRRLNFQRLKQRMAVGASFRGAELVQREFMIETWRLSE